MKQTEILTHATYVNGLFPAVPSKRLVPSRLHKFYESKFPFVSRIEFIRSKLSNFSAHVYGVSERIPSSFIYAITIISRWCVCPFLSAVNGAPATPGSWKHQVHGRGRLPPPPPTPPPPPPQPGGEVRRPTGAPTAGEPAACVSTPRRQTLLPSCPRIHVSRQIPKFRTDNSIRETKGNVDSCNPCNSWLVVYM